ncbi:MAG: CAP domain-containing protein [Chloroflexota bacterium]|jgi:hypothetical protein
MKQSLRTVAAFFLILVGVISLVVFGVQPASASDDQSLTQQVVDLVNQERLKAGLLPLKWNEQLAAAATAYAQDMASRNFFSHHSPEGTTPVERAQSAGYEAYGWGGLYVGENLARGFPTAEGAVQGWMASEGHRNNILHDKYRETGVGVAVAASGARVWVQKFGSRPKVLPVFINEDAPTTGSCDVMLSICAETVSPWGSLGDITAMMVSNNPSFSGAVWEPYSPKKSWRLESKPGLQKVYVRLIDKNHATTESSDEIYLISQQALSISEVENIEPVPTEHQEQPEFRLGFKLLADLIPEKVGLPLENEHVQVNGDSLQATTRGLMVWRKADNWTAFTDGAWTWINGPYGLQDRANDQRLPWEQQ